MHWVRTNISSIYYFTEIPIILKQHILSDWITNEPRKPWGDVLRTLSVHGYSKVWRTSLSVNKPTTCGRTEWNQYTPPITSLCGGCNYRYLVRWPSGKCHKISLMISQHFFRNQAITWANVNPDLWHHMMSLSHNELNPYPELLEETYNTNPIGIAIISRQ